MTMIKCRLHTRDLHYKASSTHLFGFTKPNNLNLATEIYQYLHFHYLWIDYIDKKWVILVHHNLFLSPPAGERNANCIKDRRNTIFLLHMHCNKKKSKQKILLLFIFLYSPIRNNNNDDNNNFICIALFFKARFTTASNKRHNNNKENDKTKRSKQQ